MWLNRSMGRRRDTALGIALGVCLAATVFGQDRPWLGVAVADAPDAGAVRVLRVFPDSPAEALGLRQGDLISSADGRPMRTPSDLVDYVRSLNPGSPLSLEISREGRSFRADAALSQIPERYVRPPGAPRPRAPLPRPGWAGLVRDAYAHQRNQLERFQERLAEVSSGAAGDTTGNLEWVRSETEALRDQLLRLESLVRMLEPDPGPEQPDGFDPRALILRGGAELGADIQVILSDPDTGRQFLLREGDVFHGYTVTEIQRTEHDLLRIVLEKDGERIELIESGL